MTAPIDRTADAYRARIRALAETKREPARDRKRRNSHTPVSKHQPGTAGPPARGGQTP